MSLGELLPLIIWVLIWAFISRSIKTAKNARKQNHETAEPDTPPAAKPAVRAVPKHTIPVRPGTRLPAEGEDDPDHDHGLKGDVYGGSLHYTSAQGTDPGHDHSLNGDVYGGSLHYTSAQGTDPGHDHSLGIRPQAAEPAAAQSTAPLLSFKENDLVRAFVMQEVLKRPGSR